MEFTIKITKKDIIIGVLGFLLIVVSVSKLSWSEYEPEQTESILHYGMVDEDVNYKIVYDQVNNVSQISAELFGDADTIQIDGVDFVRIPPVVNARAIMGRLKRLKLDTILYEDSDTIKTIRS